MSEVSRLIFSMVLALCVSVSSWAGKPESVGKDKASELSERVESEQHNPHSDERGNKGKAKNKNKDKKAKKDHKDKDKFEDGHDGDHAKADRSKESEQNPKGLEKQRDKKANQERKEAGKGSETGQKKREEHSKKWWKFWE